ncbi:hypothetical protein D3C71_1722670 [compost metagenome]
MRGVTKPPGARNGLLICAMAKLRLALGWPVSSRAAWKRVLSSTTLASNPPPRSVGA